MNAATIRVQLQHLVEVARIDDAVRGVEQELKELPAQLESLRADVAGLEAILDRERQDIEEGARLLKSQEESLQQAQEDLSKTRAKSAKARGTKEAEAVEREVEVLRRMIKEREDEVLRLSQVLEDSRAKLGEHEKELEEVRAVLVGDEEQARIRGAELASEQAKVQDERNRALVHIDSALVARYDRIRERRGQGIAWVEAATCKACRVTLSAQGFAHLQRCEEVMQCPSCQRILVYQPALDSTPQS